MKWITARDLEQWAASLSARTAFPALVADLIRASVPEISAFRFPSGDKGQVRGFDGHLIATEASPFVPGGESIWEFGVTKADAAKADAEFEKHVARISAADRANMTFVFASPQTWDNPRKKLPDWVAEKRDLKQWADVRYVDGVQLETWLEDRPAVAARYARYELGRYPHLGAQSTDEFWELYSTRFRPALCEEVLLCDREQQADVLLQKLGGIPGDVIIAADSPDEVTAFAVAAIRKAPPETRLFLEARTLIVDSEEAARQLGGHQGLIFLTRGQARQLSGVLASYGPTVVGMGGDQPRRNYDVLPRPTGHALGKALTVMGFPDDRAYQLARSCGRSVTILARILGIPGAAPEWLPQGRILIPALLAGGWDAGSPSDRGIVAQLAGGKPYTELEADLQPLVRLQDPPIDREDTVWKMRSSVDAFVHLGHLIGQDDLDRLSAAATAVFSRLEDPPDPNQPFRLARGPADSHTSWLRDGLATTLLQIAVLQDQAQIVINGKSGQQHVNEIIRSLPGLANNHRLIASLKDELPLLAEAAPDPLLLALEQLLEGDGAAIRPIFNEVDQILAPMSFHTGVLWALETLAWDPGLLPRVALILARLARIDPGGRLSNRPINSLREIFIAWSPNTNASLQQRLASLDLIIRQTPDVAWQLLLKILPHDHDTSTPTAKPRFREFGASERQVVTYGLIWETLREIITRALSLAGDDPERWVALIRALPNFEPELRTRTLELVDAFLTRAPPSERRLVWSALRQQVNRNRAFSDATWALPEDELKHLDALVQKHQPDDQGYRVAWLFDDWTPDIPGNVGHKDGPVNDARREAMRGVLAQQGTDGVLAVVERVKLPQFVAVSIGEVTDELSVFDALIVKTLGRSDQLNHFASTLSVVALQKFRERWAEHLTQLVDKQKWQPHDTATLLIAWPDEHQTWTQVAHFGTETELSYWRRKSPWIIKGDLKDCEEAVGKYLRVGRATAVLTALHSRIDEVAPETIFAILDAAVSELNQNPKAVNSMFTYHLEQAIKSLYGRENVSPLEIAKREYTYLPLLEHQATSLTLHKLLVEQPELYISVICDIFRPASGQASEPTPEIQARASAAYRLLSSLELVPGAAEGHVEIEALRSWVQAVRRLGEEADRVAITDQYVGHVLAHAPMDSTDGAWPDRAVRDVIEEARSAELETGIMIERFNMRGAFSKALYEGGNQERALAAQTRAWAAAATPWPRTAAMLESIARSWDADAKRADIRAEQDRLRD